MFTMYHDGYGNYGCTACGRRWKAGKHYPKWPIALGFSRHWRWGVHWVERGASDYEVRIMETVASVGFLRVLLGPRELMQPDLSASKGCMECNVGLARLR